jgi:predicted small secreted protein
LKTTKIVFKRPNPVVFIDAYQNIILVKEVTPAGNILAYFVLIIRYDATNNKFFIDYFSVNAQIDDEFFGLAKYQLTQIAELDINRVWIAVYAQGPTDFTVYKINIANKLNTLLTFGYLNQSNGEKITGGNSAVLFDQTHNQFLVDTRNCRPENTTFSVYDPVPICKLTDLPLYECNNVVNLIGSYFQYVSEDDKKKAITTFLYHGYGTEAIQGAANIKSKKPIRLIYDEYNFFIAISDCDIYLTNVYYDDDSSSFKVFAGLLSSVITKASKRAEIYEIWSRIETIVFIENKFYFLSCGKFYVYGTNPTQFTQLYENPCVYKTDNLTATLFVEINKYLQKIK